MSITNKCEKVESSFGLVKCYFMNNYAHLVLLSQLKLVSSDITHEDLEKALVPSIEI